MRDHPTFCEYLLDRTTEKEKMGHDTKYDLIRKILSSKTANAIFDAPFILKLKVCYLISSFIPMGGVQSYQSIKSHANRLRLNKA